jgi:hypothetical protein
VASFGVRMTREDFKQTLINQYSSIIEDIIVESESVYRSQIDYYELDTKVKKLIKTAKVDGVDESVIWSILEHRVPGYIDFLNSDIKIAA